MIMNVKTKLSEKIRPDVEAAPWVVGEITKLEAERDSLKKQLSEALAKLEKFEKMEQAYAYTDIYGSFISRATREQLGDPAYGVKVCKLYSSPQEVESDIEEQLRRT